MKLNKEEYPIKFQIVGLYKSLKQGLLFSEDLNNKIIIFKR